MFDENAIESFCFAGSIDWQKICRLSSKVRDDDGWSWIKH